MRVFGRIAFQATAPKEQPDFKTGIVLKKKTALFSENRGHRSKGRDVFLRTNSSRAVPPEAGNYRKREKLSIVTASKTNAGCSLLGARVVSAVMTDTTPNVAAEARLLAEVKSACTLHPDMQITVDMAANDDLARKHGWSDAEAMREGVQRVLKSLPAEMAQRIVVKTRAE